MREPVLVTRELPPPVMARLGEACDVTVWRGEGAMPRERLLAAASGKRALLTLLTDRVDDELLDAAGGQLVIVANYAVGADNIDLAACSRRHVMASNTPDVVTETTADMAWALLLAAARRVAEGDRLLRSGRPWVWGPQMMLGHDVHGKVLGVVGFGRIGRAVARRAAGFRMSVLAARPPGAAAAGGAADAGARWVDLDDLLAAADFVTLHVPLTPLTRHLVSAERLRRMKPTAVLVNTSRGPVVDERALAEALATGVIAAAGLDVFEHEPQVDPLLLQSERVVLAPHLGSATVGTRVAMGMLAVDNVLAALRGERPPTLLDAGPFERRPPGTGRH